MHNYKSKKGCQIILFVYINKERLRIPLGIYCDALAFDSKKQTSSNKAISEVLETYSFKILSIFQKSRYLNKPLTNSRFLFLLENEGLAKDFILFFFEAMRKEAVNVEHSTFKSWQKTFNKLKEYKKSIQIVDIEFEIYQRF